MISQTPFSTVRQVKLMLSSSVITIGSNDSLLVFNFMLNVTLFLSLSSALPTRPAFCLSDSSSAFLVSKEASIIFRSLSSRLVSLSFSLRAVCSSLFLSSKSFCVLTSSLFHVSKVIKALYFQRGPLLCRFIL